MFDFKQSISAVTISDKSWKQSCQHNGMERDMVLTPTILVFGMLVAKYFSEFEQFDSCEVIYQVPNEVEAISESAVFFV